MTYKYSLEIGSKKFICPNCNKKTFVRYINNHNNTYLNYNYGRCDRINSCNYFKKPETVKGFNLKSTKTINNGIIKPVKLGKLSLNHNNRLEINKDHISHHNKIELESTLRKENNLTLYLLKHFPKIDIKIVCDKFCLGTSKLWDNSPVFWQIDEQKNIRGGKIIAYCTNTGKRIKEPRPKINWMHKVLKKEEFHLKQCLFGLHQISEMEKSKFVCIVESEKTAIIMSIFQPNYIWLATGSCNGFKESLLLPVKNRKIIACPDKGIYNDWKQLATILNQQGYNVVVNSFIEEVGTEKGFDLVDVLL